LSTDEVVFSSLDKALPIEKIDLSKRNVRLTKPADRLEELKSSIKRLGLIQPPVVIQRKDRYELVAGQRRLLACKELGWATMPALVIKPVSPLTEEMISFGENIHRRKLPYDDTIRVCDQLYNSYTGPASRRIKRMSLDLGISPGTVAKYLAYRLVPHNVQQFVVEGKLSASLAYRLTSAFWPNLEMIESVAIEATKMTKAEWERALDAKRQNPKATVREVVEAARKPPSRQDIVIQIDLETYTELEKVAAKRNTDVQNLVRRLILDFIEEGEP